MANLHDDIELIARIQKGDRAAFKEIVLKYQDRIYTLCRYMVRNDDALDAAQDVFIKAYNRLKDFRPEASLYTWLYRIAVNTCLDYRKKHRAGLFEDDFAIDRLPSAQPSPEQIFESKETGRLLEAALRRLPAKLRAAIVLKEIEGLSYEEISNILGTSLGTTKSRLSRAREELRRLLMKDKF